MYVSDNITPGGTPSGTRYKYSKGYKIESVNIPSYKDTREIAPVTFNSDIGYQDS